jgi:phosphoribosyl-ATP pyrophosphohydrolase
MAERESSGMEVLQSLYEVILERKATRPDRSYVVRLLDAGLPAIAAKIREEADELVEAAGGDDAEHTANECADLLFHTWVLLGLSEVPPDRVFSILRSRFGVGGLDEKESRGQSSGTTGAED